MLSSVALSHAPAAVLAQRASSRGSGVPRKTNGLGRAARGVGGRGLTGDASPRRTVAAAAAAVAPPDWATLDALTAPVDVGGYNIRPQQVPSSSTDPSLPTSADSTTAKRVLLYRDTNAWCPYCERVWLALHEKGVPFDTVFIDLRNKPLWYLDMVPSALVPAVKIDGELVYESRDILLAIEHAFPHSDGFPPLLPPAGTAERTRVEGLMDLADDAQGVGRVGFGFLLGGGFGGPRDESKVPELRVAFEESLRNFEAALAGAPGGGPFLGGAAPSLADIMLTPQLSRFAANMPAFRGFDMRAHPEFPRVAAWYKALEARPAYAAVRADPGTHNATARTMFRMKPVEGAAVEGMGAGAGEAGAGEAARKLVMNYDAVVADVVKNAGIVVSGSDAAAAAAEVHAAVDVALRSLAARLAAQAGIEAAPVEAGPPPAINLRANPPAAEEKAARARAAAVSAATWAFIRQRISAPRDMSGAGAAALRAAALTALAELDF
eukprot:CAMPEP_0197577012 /NCGR_PEP_ID=MMETSP1326-20131121/1797_1 /TAXON_ID=1155430 /ORGANISM="Genus nov. species nov., Strain RCC2288" /LENGTH=493 /DNA_ID=CAMNT_0043140007 /DNA_START=64 /DNA_END=1545 /DNA_ORIENTATION=-